MLHLVGDGAEKGIISAEKLAKTGKNSTFGCAEDTFARQNKEKLVFLWFCPHLIVTLHCEKQ